ncbi:MAG: 1-acyl-sn-glycerol-3-phosphate acyltransferase [Rhodobacteraceae bacterium]|nr:1-acyl-sn-glycerol-3-phosphate acyltransferase [Paracoccaceae bacterium]
MEARGWIRRAAAFAAGNAILLFARFVTAVRPVWAGAAPEPRLRIYFANHTSNGDFVLIWAVLPRHMRLRTRPVAALDYWLTTPLRAFVGRDVFNAVLIDRRPEHRTADPVATMLEALDAGSSLIIFPEGRRNEGPAPILPFRSGLFHLGAARPGVELVPTWIHNLNRVMPKGELIPVPLNCTVTFGTPIHVGPGETKDAFLARASAALLALAGAEAGSGAGAAA